MQCKFIELAFYKPRSPYSGNAFLSDDIYLSVANIDAKLALGRGRRCNVMLGGRVLASPPIG